MLRPHRAGPIGRSTLLSGNPIERLAADLTSREDPSDGSKPVMVAIDGHSAAGKSTLADLLQLALGERCTVVAMDDFYRLMDPTDRAALTPREGVDQYYDWQRLDREVLAPARVGSRLSYGLHDWDNNVIGSDRSLDCPPLLIVEGVYSSRAELREHFDIHVLVTSPPPVRLARQIARGENSIEWIERWAAAETLYFDNHDRSPPDYLVDGTPPPDRT